MGFQRRWGKGMVNTFLPLARWSISRLEMAGSKDKDVVDSARTNQPGWIRVGEGRRRREVWYKNGILG